MNQEMEKRIKTFVAAYREQKKTETAWREPVIGVADAEDALFVQLKEIIGPSHAMPSDIVPGARSVISYFIPFSENIVESNLPGEESSREWDYANIETNQLLLDLNRFLCAEIETMGFHASLLPPTYNYDEEKLISDWSHKSAAFIAGIGTFGIHHVLITTKGCCGRLGSVITDMELTPTPRPKREYCLYKYNGSCGRCIEKCVNHAFDREEKKVKYDRKKCNEQIYGKWIPQYPIGAGDACGKCMCGVPCSLKAPLPVSSQ
jgi:epoxyqueuosine reductase QueG